MSHVGVRGSTTVPLRKDSTSGILSSFGPLSGPILIVSQPYKPRDPAANIGGSLKQLLFSPTI